jgi:hypothetical protein
MGLPPGHAFSNAASKIRLRRRLVVCLRQDDEVENMIEPPIPAAVQAVPYLAG